MFNSKTPSPDQLPSTGRLIRSTLLAAIVAGVLLVTVVMPAEYGIDPTGFGRITGLQQMGEIKQSLAEEIAAEAAQETAAQKAGQSGTPAQAQPSAPVSEQQTSQPDQGLQHQMQVTLKPNDAAEIKLKMDKGKAASYKWWSDKGKVNFDVHADSDPLKIKYHPYYKGSEIKRAGILKAAFDGYHGWFWRNRTKDTLVVTLETKGDYLEIVRVK